MRVRQVTTDVSGEVTEQWIDVPGVMTPEEAQAADAQAAKLEANAANLKAQASDALTNLRAYRDLTNPTNAQTVAAVKLLCKVAIGLIRMRLERFDATD
jgi:hypothetical protein